MTNKLGSDSNSGQFPLRRTTHSHRNWTLTPIYGVGSKLIRAKLNIYTVKLSQYLIAGVSTVELLPFIAEVVKAIVWPAVTLTIFLTLRKPLLALIPNLEKLQYKNWTLIFRRGVTEMVIDKSPTLSAPAQIKIENSATTPDITQNLYAVAKLSPTAAIIQAWASFENLAIQKLIKLSKDNNNESIRGNSRLGHALLAENLFSKIDFENFHKLRELRNIAAHKADMDLTEEDAIRYIDLTMALATKVK